MSKSAAQSAVIRDALSQFGDLEVPVTAWVDAAGRLRKLDLAMDVSGIASKLELGAAVAPKIDITMEFYEFGVPVDVVVPPGVISAQAAAADAVAQSDLRNALTAEKTLYTDDQMYTADAPTLKQVEPTLGWGTKLPVAVADTSGQPDQVVCLSERSASGSTFAIADVATGFGAGTYFAKSACPAVVTEQTVSAMAKSW